MSEKSVTWEELLHEVIGEPAFRVVRALDRGEDGYTIWRQWNEDNLPQSLTDVLAFARSQNGWITTQDMAENPRWANLSPSSRSNMVRVLERRGLLICEEQPQFVTGGGRRFVYRVWRMENAT
jgi:uncharacterized membrane protein